ncbi:MAG: hypothetical protein ABIJ74_03315 [archaeon]
MAVPKPRGKIARGIRELRLRKLKGLRGSRKRKETLANLMVARDTLAEMRGPGGSTGPKVRPFLDGYLETLKKSADLKRARLRQKRKGLL